MKTLWVILGASLMLGASAVHAGEVDEAMAAAAADVEAGRCDDAVKRLSSIDGLAARADLVGGRCLVGQGAYTEALAAFKRAELIGDLPENQVGELELNRAIALFHLERYAEADAALDRAEGVTPNEGQLSLYRGMIALRRNDNERAAPELERAARLSPESTEPVASYYAGLAWQGAAERTKAREAFKRVIAIDPDGPWGKEAANLLDSTELFPYFVRASVGFENDDNVLLRATGTDRIGRDGGKDWLGVWEVEAGVQLFSRGPWAGGVLGSYSGSKHHELGAFDVHFPTIGAFLDYRIAPTTLSRLRYSFGHAWVDKGAFLRTQSVEASLTHTWEEAGTTEIYGDFKWNDFRFENQDERNGGTPSDPNNLCPINNLPPGAIGDPCGPSSINEARERDRDGYGLSASLEHRYRLSLPDSIDEIFESVVVRAGYRFGFYDSQGTEWEYFSNILSAGFNVEFPFDISFDGSAAWEHYDYLNPSTFADNTTANIEYALDQDDREEDAFLVEAELEKDLSEMVSVSARYTYYDSSSNRRVYDYRRHIVGAYVNFRFD